MSLEFLVNLNLGILYHAFITEALQMRKSHRPSIITSGAPVPWCLNALVPLFLRPSSLLFCFAGYFLYSTVTQNIKTMDKQLIDQGHQQFLHAMAANNTESLLEVLTDDVVFYPPGSEPVVGHEGVSNWYNNIKTQMLTENLSVPSREVVVSGDYGIETGHFQWVLKPNDGSDSINVSGNFIAIWQKLSDGSWKVSKDIWNSRE
jgi:ketosteroid isomerase-like protein